MRIFDEMKKIFNPYEDEDDYEEGFDDQDVSPFVDDRDRRSYCKHYRKLPYYFE